MTKAPGPVANQIRAKLDQIFQPAHLEILDQSHLHAGHAHVASLHADGRKGGETHFSVTIVSAKFAGLNRPARQRLVYAALAEELAGPVHALSMRTLTPTEFAG
jgi:BolA protein